MSGIVTDMARQIRLHHQPPAIVDVNHVYFAFASGRLSYDCVSCGSKCCRGFGYLARVGGEIERQFASRRSLPVFAVRSPKESYGININNSAPGCFFLTADGLCEVHASDGFDAKPETCRLFPFNYLRRIGKYLIVRPHQYLCPLEIAPAGSYSRGSDHESLFDAMSSQGIAASVPSCVSGEINLDDVVTEERRVVALSEQYLDSDDYVSFAAAQTRETVSPHPDPAPSLRRLPVLVADVMGVPLPEDFGGDRELNRTMIAVTPFLRSLLRFPNAGPTHRYQLPQARLPHAMVCAYVFAEFARSAGMKSITFQSVAKIERDFRRIIWLLALADSVVAWRRWVPINVNGFHDSEERMRFVRLAKALLPTRLARDPETLRDILYRSMPEQPLPRVLFLRQSAELLAGNLLPLEQVESQPFKTTFGSRIRSTVHRWTLDTLNDAALQAAYDRVNVSSPQSDTHAS